MTPHVSVRGTLDFADENGEDFEYFSFTVIGDGSDTEESSGRVILNVSLDGESDSGSVSVELWNQDQGDEGGVVGVSSTTALGGQVYTGLNPQDQFAARVSGTDGVDYVLHISVENHDYNLAFAADFGLAEIRETMEVNSSRLDAQTIEFGRWSQNPDSDIESSTEIPHLTILGSGDGENDFYSFEISSAMLASGGIVYWVFLMLIMVLRKATA